MSRASISPRNSPRHHHQGSPAITSAATLLLLLAALAVPARLCAQIPAQPPATPSPAIQTPAPPTAATDPHTYTPTLTPLPPPRPLTPGVVELLNLEGAFSDAVSKGGGPAFASFFAEDGVTLSNGQPPVTGQAAIAATATWRPSDYQLTWFAEGAQMGLSKDTGFTWGHYDAVTTGKDGKTSSTGGRYITVWKKVKGENKKMEWKVALLASADEPKKLEPRY